VQLSQLSSQPNLKLAWRRITTGGNQQYKRLFRGLYYAYEVALEANLSDLRQRLLGGTFVAQHPERLYLPKASGLHRPVTLLDLEDQIVLQAFANLAAARMQSRRSHLQFRVVFSNILEKRDSLFFFRRWQETYAAFQARIATHFRAGRRWVGDFDLAAFYDTISHELLLKTLYPRTTSDDLQWMASCLRTWSSDAAASGHGHGLPQGPLASDFLAECFLVPIDEAMRNCKGYLRYVDDVRLFGRTEDETRSHLISLERFCRERGLIPQTGKFALKQARSIDEAMGMLPSIADPQHDDGSERLSLQEARRLFSSAVAGRPMRVVQRTPLRYALYRAPTDRMLLYQTLRLVPHYPEHSDAFFAFLGRFGFRRAIERLCLDLVRSSPYAYVRGEAWHILARYRSAGHVPPAHLASALTQRAIGVARKTSPSGLAERWGACHFLCAVEEMTGAKYSRFAKYQSTLLQALLAPALPSSAFAQGEAVEDYLKRSRPEAGLSVCSSIHQRRLKLATFGLKSSRLPSQVANTLRELGVISGKSIAVDPIAEILERRYMVPREKSWRDFLGAEYVHALGLLKQAEAVFAGGRSFWLVCQNGFNQTIFLALQRHFAATAHAGTCTTTNKVGQLTDFGVTLEVTGPFSVSCPTIADVFRDMNARRNRLPVSHPYEKKTSAQTQYLRPHEARDLVQQLRGAYTAFIALMP